MMDEICRLYLKLQMNRQWSKPYEMWNTKHRQCFLPDGPIVNSKGMVDSYDQREWTVNHLRYIGNNTETRQAFAIANYLDNDRPILC